VTRHSLPLNGLDLRTSNPIGFGFAIFNVIDPVTSE
jgi:hypothetical protein